MFFSFPVADFVTGVPKGLMLYGLVREPHVAYRTERTTLNANTETQFTRADQLRTNSCTMNRSTVEMLRSVLTSSVSSQVSVLSGRDLKSLINFTGEQVCDIVQMTTIGERGGKMKEFALWRGCLCQGQRCSLQYAQLKGS